MRAYLINDTSAFHCGSAAVCAVLRREIEGAGHSLAVEVDKTAIDESALEACDIVVVNGEGSMHDSTPRARRMMNALAIGQRLGKHTVLCNTSWFGMGQEFSGILRALDHCTVRDRLSYDEMVRNDKVTPSISPDLSLFSDETPKVVESRRRILATDFYSREFRAFVRPLSGQLAKFETVDMAAVSWAQMLDEVASSEFLATGRHHGVYAACKVQRPFFATPGNTPKIEGLIAWSGFPLPFASEPSQLAGLLARANTFRSVFAEFFGWLHERPRWRFPL